MSIDKYETHCITFIDILGFSDLIERSRTDRDTFIWIRRLFMERDEMNSHIDSDNVAMHEVEEIIPSLRGKLSYAQATAFSDSVVLSMRVGNSFNTTSDLSDSDMASLAYPAVTSIARRTANLCYRLLEIGFLARGGIAIGDLFHESNIVFGPALISAYKLESEQAIYPRILFSKDAALYDIQQATFLGSGAKESAMMIRDRDGLQYLNVLGYAIEIGKIFEYDSLGRIRNNLIILRGKARNSRAQANIEWYIRYFNDMVDLMVKQQIGLQTPLEKIR